MAANPLINIFKVPDLRRKIFFTILCLVIYRAGGHIPTPGINPEVLYNYFSQVGSDSGIFSMLNLLSGGSLFRFTIFGLGIMPYISASIVIQLLTATLPALERLQKEGETGRKKINQYTRYLTLGLCMVQSLTMANWIKNATGPVLDAAGNQIGKASVVYFQQPVGIWFVLLVMITATTGTMFLMWLGDQITEKGIGNGISLIIMAGIAARIPGSILETVQQVLGTSTSQGQLNPLSVVVLMIIFAVVIFLVVYEESGQRRIPVQYAKRVVGRRVYGAQSTHIPFKINPSGVIPIIFASALMTIPAGLATMVQGNESLEWLQGFLRIFGARGWPYIAFYFFLVIGFAYIYTAVQFNPVDIADNLKRSGGFIPGIRPGTQTAEYLQTVLTRLTIGGSIFLAMIAVFPDLLLKIPLFAGVPPSLLYLMGGTSLLILIAVDLDLMKQIESQLQMHNYEGFMKRSKNYRR